MFGEFQTVSLGLAFLAGLVTTLSPCVLPLLPMIAAAAAGRSRFGLLALAGGLALAFTTVGVALAAGGHAIGLDERSLRLTAGVLMAVVGCLLISQRLQSGFSRLTGRLGSAGHGAMSRVQSDHPAAQFLIGLLMGVAWSPCVGPTLGAAIAQAAGGGSLGASALIMGTFSVAAVVPLTAAGLASRSVFQARRDRLAVAGQIGRTVMGWSLPLIGILVLSGLDKQLEAWLLDIAPDWLPALTTGF